MAVVYNMYQNSLQVNSFHFLQISNTLYRFLNSQHVALVVAPLLPVLHTLILMLQEESTVSFVKVCRKYQIYIIFWGQQLAFDFMSCLRYMLMLKLQVATIVGTDVERIQHQALDRDLNQSLVGAVKIQTMQMMTHQLPNFLCQLSRTFEVFVKLCLME